MLNFVNTVFLGKVPNRFRTDFLNRCELETWIHVRCAVERACNSHSDSIDGEIKSVTKNSNTKTWIFSLLGVLGKYTENSKIFPKLSVAKNSNTFYFAVE